MQAKSETVISSLEQCLQASDKAVKSSQYCGCVEKLVSHYGIATVLLRQKTLNVTKRRNHLL